VKIQLIYLDTGRGKSHTPLGLAYLASHIINAGHEVEIMPCETLHFDPGHIFKRIYESKANVFGITAMFPEIRLARDMVWNIKNIRKDATIILGGILATSVPEFALHKTDADIAVKGEAELTVVKLLNCLESNSTAISDVPGIVFKEANSDFVDTGDAQYEKDLSKILRPSYDLFPVEHLMNQHFYPHDGKMKFADILTSRGCPFRCNFCYCVSDVRYRTIDDVVDELILLKKKYNIDGVNFLDENFASNKNRIGQYLEAIKYAGLDLKFTATARAAVIDDEMVSLLYEAGCRAVNIGLESGDQAMLDRMHKKTTVEQIEYSIETARLAGMFVEYPCMVGNIGETEESMRKTFGLLKKLAWGDFQWRLPFFCTPFPGTEIYDFAIENDLISGVLEFYNKFLSFNELSVNLTEMTDQDFIKLFNECSDDLKKHYFSKLSQWRPSHK
jgi:radical SAM superfamily enzyme YgiQ (UPF0313 family)